MATTSKKAKTTKQSPKNPSGRGSRQERPQRPPEQPIIVKGSATLLSELKIVVDDPNASWDIERKAGKITLSRAATLGKVNLSNFKGQGGGNPDNPHTPQGNSDVKIEYTP